jgi:hypothetical protein
MKAFSYPSHGTWLPRPAYEALASDCLRTWEQLELTDPAGGDGRLFQCNQNKGMLLKFFLEQTFGDGEPRGRALRLVERDAAGVRKLRSRLVDLISREGSQWIVWGLSFATFRFHVFEIGRDCSNGPFCISPMAVCCAADDLFAASGYSARREFADKQVSHIDWEVIESRIACLEKPLDVFGSPLECVESVCEVLEVGEGDGETSGTHRA